MRVITAKIGPDDHFRGIHAVSQALRDAGIEVIYLGTGQRFDRVVAAAVQEDVDVIALGFHYGGQLETIRRIMPALRENGLEHVPVIVGGVISPQLAEKLRAEGVAAVYPPGSSLTSIVDFVRGVGAVKQ
ncbi:MAG: cobalamin-dependent protein [Burkholderiaceae bacterium]|nr:cobalamin-dependent protein [Burkholderiaceae bacterium]